MFEALKRFARAYWRNVTLLDWGYDHVSKKMRRRAGVWWLVPARWEYREPSAAEREQAFVDWADRAAW